MQAGEPNTLSLVFLKLSSVILSNAALTSSTSKTLPNAYNYKQKNRQELHSCRFSEFNKIDTKANEASFTLVKDNVPGSRVPRSALHEYPRGKRNRQELRHELCPRPPG